VGVAVEQRHKEGCMISHDAKQRMRAVAAQYPTLRSAILPALHIAQNEAGYLTQDALESVAEVLRLNPDEVKSVATFYTMFYQAMPGKRVLKVCTSISCYLRGCDQLVTHLEQRMGITRGHTTPDGRFTLLTTECLASCGSAPVLQVNDEFVEHVTLDSADALLAELNAEIEAATQQASQRKPTKAPGKPTQAGKGGKASKPTPAPQAPGNPATHTESTSAPKTRSE
jgi:NADH-quinone oxidoreductase E subunit